VSLSFPRRRLFRCRPAGSVRGTGRPGGPGWLLQWRGELVRGGWHGAGGRWGPGDRARGAGERPVRLAVVGAVPGRVRGPGPPPRAPVRSVRRRWGRGRPAKTSRRWRARLVPRPCAGRRLPGRYGTCCRWSARRAAAPGWWCSAGWSRAWWPGTGLRRPWGLANAPSSPGF